MNFSVKAINVMKSEERGSFDNPSCGDIEIVRWNDNSVVALRSNAYGVETVTAKRWVKSKDRQNIKQPAFIASCIKVTDDLIDYGNSLLKHTMSLIQKNIRKWIFTPLFSL